MNPRPRDHIAEAFWAIIIALLGYTLWRMAMTWAF